MARDESRDHRPARSRTRKPTSSEVADQLNPEERGRAARRRGRATEAALRAAVRELRTLRRPEG